jgi:hypothetical protein
MKIIKKLFEKIAKVDKKILGRWKIDYCDKITKIKVDYSNEDHCGPCGIRNDKIKPKK